MTYTTPQCRPQPWVAQAASAPGMTLAPLRQPRGTSGIDKAATDVIIRSDMRRPLSAFLALLGLLAATVACHAPIHTYRSPLVTPSPTPYPTPTATATPEPRDLLPAAALALHNGDFAAAAWAYEQALTSPLAPDAAGQARIGLATAYLRGSEYEKSVIALESFLASHGGSELDPQAHFLLGEALVGLGDPIRAEDEYRAYIAAGTVITPYLNRWIGQALHQGADYAGAAAAFLEAAVESPSLAFEAAVREELALAYVAQNDYGAAVAQYDAILSLPEVASRARIEYQAGQTLMLAGDSEGAYQRYMTAVDQYPTEYNAYLSLVELVDAGIPVDYYQRGLVDYHAGAYSPAVGAFYNYIDMYPLTHSGDAHWYAGLCFLSAGSPALAENEFRLLIDTHPENGYWGHAWIGLASALADQDLVAEAVEAYRRLADELPEHYRAPEALYRAALLLERTGDIDGARAAYLDCGSRYPESDYGPLCLFRSGIQSYQLGDPAGAAATWGTVSEAHLDSAYGPTALLWLGKLRLGNGDPDGASEAFWRAYQADPEGYYGLRARDLALDPLAPAFPVVEYAPNHDSDADQALAEQWLRQWLQLPEAAEPADLAELDPALKEDPRLQRGLALWSLGRFSEGRAELEAFRRSLASDALAQYQLALLFRDIGLYRSSLLCAETLIALSPVENTLEAPAFIARLAYPTYYADLVAAGAAEYRLDPLLVFSVIRRESHFEGLATSWADARGLMQIWPPTGADIAASLDWPPGYDTHLLYLPYVSLRFGCYYLGLQVGRYHGRVDAALAGYNGGPLNADDWLAAAGDDPDLFVETVTLSETRSYVRYVRENLAIYQALYSAE
jgi:soluble lytic murein transglycosylase